MTKEMETTLHRLVNTLSQHNAIRAIGRSGGERPLPKAGQGDVDLFVYCTRVPGHHEREEMLRALGGEIEQVSIGKLEGGHWGEGDSFRMAGVETWLLYFTIAEARAELEAILSGQYLGRFDSYYYPIGRCATWKTMQVYDDPDGFLSSIKQRLQEYPEQLALAAMDYHCQALEDVEDLKRAVQCKDVFFYHFAMDLALDHFLQALFALNREYFPSRKRSEAYLHDFKIKPPECETRLRQVIALGRDAETLEQSYGTWKGLVQDTMTLSR